MSSEGENGKTKELEGADAKAEEETDAAVKKPPADTNSKAEDNNVDEKKDDKDAKKEIDVPEKNDTAKIENDNETEDKPEKDDKKKDEKKKDDKKETSKIEKEEEDGEGSEKDEDKKNDDEEVEDEEVEEEEDEEEEEEDEEDDEEEKKPPSKDKKKKKDVKDAKEEKDKENDKDKDGKIDIPEGPGTQLGEIPRIDASISRFKNDDLKLLHKLLFKKESKTLMIKKNIKRFNGFDFKKDSEEYKKKLATVEKFEIKQLRIVCEMLDLEKKGGKDEMSSRILEFLIEPKDSGKTVGGGRPKRTAAVRANNRGYSSHDDSYSSDEKHTPRARRNMGKRANLKDETSSESEEFRPSEASEDELPKKRKRGGRKKKDDSDDELSEVDNSPSTDESEGGPKGKKKKATTPKVKGKGPGRGRGRRPAAATPAKKTPAKRGRKKKESSEEEDEKSEDAHDDGSSSEDEPLAKKTAKAPQPPTDDEIKTTVKQILEGANLEEITMKTVCKQVYAHYPEFDLTHKKDYIKTTVKSLIST